MSNKQYFLRVRRQNNFNLWDSENISFSFDNLIENEQDGDYYLLYQKTEVETKQIEIRWFKTNKTLQFYFEDGKRLSADESLQFIIIEKPKRTEEQFDFYYDQKKIIQWPTENEEIAWDNTTDLRGSVVFIKNAITDLSDIVEKIPTGINGLSIPADIKLSSQVGQFNGLKILIYRGSKKKWETQKYPINWFTIEKGQRNQSDSEYFYEDISPDNIKIGSEIITIPKDRYLRIYLEDEHKIPEYELVDYMATEKEFVYGIYDQEDNIITVDSRNISTTDGLILIYCNFGDSLINITPSNQFKIKIASYNDNTIIVSNTYNLNLKTVYGYSLEEVKGVQLFAYDRITHDCYFIPEYPYYN